MGQRESKPNNPLKSILISREAMEQLKELQAFYKASGFTEAGKLKGFLEFLIRVEYADHIGKPEWALPVEPAPAPEPEPETGNKFF